MLIQKGVVIGPDFKELEAGIFSKFLGILVGVTSGGPATGRVLLGGLFGQGVDKSTCLTSIAATTISNGYLDRTAGCRGSCAGCGNAELAAKFFERFGSYAGGEILGVFFGRRDNLYGLRQVGVGKDRFLQGCGIGRRGRCWRLRGRGNGGGPVEPRSR